MTDIVAPILGWLNAHPHLAGLATFVISASESVAIIGTIVPGSIMMTAIGTLAGAGIIPLWQAIIWAILGAIAGDGISYWFGYTFKHRLPYWWPFRTYPLLLKTGEKFFHKYGPMSVFIGRFVGPVRALVPMVAGMLGMPPLRFMVANILSAIGWAPAYMLPGIILGAAAQELPPDIGIRIILVTLLIVLFCLLCFWFIYKLLCLIYRQTIQLQTKIWGKLKKSQYFSWITHLLRHHSPHKSRGQLNLAFYLGLSTFLFIVLAFYVKYQGPGTLLINDAVFHLFRGIRSPRYDDVFLNIMLLGQKEVILPVVIALFGWLIIKKRWRAAFHALALGFLAAASIFVVKNIIQTPRPWGIVQNLNEASFSMPSGHTTLATTLFMGLAFLMARSMRSNFRWPIYTVALLITLAVGIARLYLGAHWFTDVLGGWLLSTAILILVIISYQREKTNRINPISIFLVCLITLSITFSYFHAKHFNKLYASYKQLEWPSAVLAMNEWWINNDALSAYRVSLFGFPSQPINIEWEGNLATIKATLLANGWQKPPARDFISTLHRISDVGSGEYLPLVSPQYLDRTPALTLTHKEPDAKNLLVIRLWNANRTIKETQHILWVGVVNRIPRSYSWLYKKNPSNIPVSAALVFQTGTGMVNWQSKILPREKQQILLIRDHQSH